MTVDVDPLNVLVKTTGSGSPGIDAGPVRCYRASQIQQLDRAPA